MRWMVVVVVCATWGATWGGLAAGQADSVGLARDAAAAMEAGEYERAAELFEGVARANPQAFVPRVNLAVATTLAGDAETGALHLVGAVERGFTHLESIEARPELEALRATETYGQLDAAWPRVLEARRDADLRTWRERLGPAYEYEVDEQRRVIVVTDPRTARASDVVDELARTEAVLGPILAGGATDERTPWVVVAVLSPRDYVAFLASESGLSDPSSAGAVAQRLAGQYDHDAKRLVSRDAGSTLRHEYVHVLHHRQQDRLVQRHAPWVLEGLACLVEAIDEQGRPVVTERLEVVRRRLRANRLEPLRELATTDFEAFNGSRVLGNYAVAAAFWLWQASEGDAPGAYEEYVEGFETDPGGEGVLDGADDEAFRDWVRGQRRR